MKTFFLLIWALLSLPLSFFLGLHAWREPSWGSLFALGLLLYCVFCSLRLILAAYRPWGRLGRSSTGDWLCLLLLPLSLLPLQAAYETWQQGLYVPSTYRGHRRGSLELGQLVLSELQEWVGYLGPVLLLATLGIATALVLLSWYGRK